MVLIDTAGLQASDPALRMQLESLAGRGIKSKNYLVLATTSQKQVLTAAYHSYKRCGLAGCILTKLDETASLGEVLSLAISHELPVAYLTDGPRIPDDLHLPRRHQLVSRAVSVQMQEEPSEEAMVICRRPIPQPGKAGGLGQDEHREMYLHRWSASDSRGQACSLRLSKTR